VKPKDSRILKKRKEKLAKRLDRKQWREQNKPFMGAKNIHYEMAERVRAIECGGIGAFHMLACNSGLVDAINENVDLLKRHLPYHESDHVLNIACFPAVSFKFSSAIGSSFLISSSLLSSLWTSILSYSSWSHFTKTLISSTEQSKLPVIS
jgi:hypothetical protein